MLSLALECHLYSWGPFTFYLHSVVVSTLLNFVRMFVRAHDENKKQLEMEKKKAEKDAQNEKKSTMASPRKLSENLVQRPIKSGIFKWSSALYTVFCQSNQDLFSYRQHHYPPWLTPRYKLTENHTIWEKLEFKSREVFYIAAKIKHLNAVVHCTDGYSFFLWQSFLTYLVFRSSSLALLFQRYPYTSFAPLFTKLLGFWSRYVDNLWRPPWQSARH